MPPVFPVARVPHRGAVIVRVYTAWIGVGRRFTPPRKKGRFSGKNNAKRSFAEICAVSDSTCEKSGFTVASMALSAFGINFTSARNADVVIRGDAMALDVGLDLSPSRIRACFSGVQPMARASESEES